METRGQAILVDPMESQRFLIPGREPDLYRALFGERNPNDTLV